MTAKKGVSPAPNPVRNVVSRPLIFKEEAHITFDRTTQTYKDIPVNLGLGSQIEKEFLRAKIEQDEQRKKDKKGVLVIGAPELGSFKQVIHVTSDPTSSTGLAGLPAEWEIMILTSGITKTEITEHSDAMIRIMTKNAASFALKPNQDTQLPDVSLVPQPNSVSPRNQKMPADVTSQSSSQQNQESLSARVKSPLPRRQDLQNDMKWNLVIREGASVDKEYPIRRKIGEGSTGYVYVAMRKQAEKNYRIALKVMLINSKMSSPRNQIVEEDKPMTDEQFQEDQMKKMQQMDMTNISSIANEIYIMKTTEVHPNIVQFYDAFAVVRKSHDPQGQIDKIEHQLWILLEYMPGGSGTQLLTVNGSMPEHIIAYLIREMISGLAFLHGK
ncbi:MAG: hypothetical protein EZS28_017579, partial [Streblomastix strix]